MRVVTQGFLYFDHDARVLRSHVPHAAATGEAASRHTRTQPAKHELQFSVSKVKCTGQLKSG